MLFLSDFMHPLKDDASRFFEDLQGDICRALEELDGKARFGSDVWKHAAGGGGGVTRVISGGAVFEKGGVNVSGVSSRLTERLAERMGVEPQTLFASGISLVLHPLSPMVPAVHMNLRYIELENGDAWFGGGTDLTPSYLFPDDAIHFHRQLKEACDAYAPSAYERFKKWCDDYFYLKHRGETRGVGGIFFDYLRDEPAKTFAFIRSVGLAFLPAYVPVVQRRSADPYGEAERRWQLARRGRYVEFNLVYDRGTLFGLETEGRTESILMSLPPVVTWPYETVPAPGSREEQLVSVLKHPQAWL